MKMQTTAGQLRAGLRLFRGIVHRRSTIPVLGMVRLEDGKITGTNLDMELSVALPTMGPMQGGVLLDYFATASLADCIDDGEEVTVSEDERVASITFNGSSYRMASLPVTDYPDFRQIEGAATETGNLGLVAAMQRVRFAISTEETRYYLNGVALIDGPDGPIVVATDGHRLAMMPLGTMPEGADGAIIYKATVQWLCAGKREPDRCIFSQSPPAVRFEFAGATLSAKRIDGTFPDIFRVLPKDQAPVFSANRAAMLRTLRRMRAFSGRTTTGVKLSGSGGELTLTLNHPDHSATEKLPLSETEGVAFEVGYNIEYLVDLLTELRGDVVTFSADRQREISAYPALVTAEGDPLRILLMPMRV